MILHPSYEKLITALYTRDSEYITSDTVFGVKSSLMVDYVWTEDLKLAERYGVKPFKRVVDGVEKQGFWLLEHDFILVKKQDPALRKTHDWSLDYLSEYETKDYCSFIMQLICFILTR